MINELERNLNSIKHNIKWIKIEIIIFSLIASFGLGVIVGLIIG